MKEIPINIKIIGILTFITLLFTVKFSNGQILLEDHNKAVGLINKSQELIKQGSFPDAINNLKEAIKADSTIRDAYTLIYQAFLKSENLSGQKEYLEKAKKLFSDDDEFFYYSGKLYQKKGDFKNAIIEFTEAIKFSKINGEDYPIVYDYHSSRGICFLKLDKFNEAVEDFNYAIKLNDKKSGIYSNRGYALFKINKKEEACESWKKATELGDNSANSYIVKFCK